MSIHSAKPYLLSVIKHFNTIQQERHRGGDVSYAIFVARVGTKWIGQFFEGKQRVQNLMSTPSLFSCVTEYSPIADQPLVAESTVEHLSKTVESRIDSRSKAISHLTVNTVSFAVKSLVAIGAAYFAARL